MANKKHLSVLKHGADNWNLWRIQNADLMPDLSHADLSELNLSGYNLMGVNLSNAVVSGSTFNGISFYNSHLEGVDFTRANISGVVEWPFGYQTVEKTATDPPPLGLAESLDWRGEKIAITPKEPNIKETDASLFARLVDAQMRTSAELLQSLERSNLDIRVLEKFRNYNTNCTSSNGQLNIFHLDALYRTISAYLRKNRDEFSEIDALHLESFLQQHRTLRETDIDWMNFQIRAQQSDLGILSPASVNQIVSVISDPVSDLVVEKDAQVQIVDEIEQPDSDIDSVGNSYKAKHQSVRNIAGKLLGLLKDPPKLAKNMEAIAKIRDLLANILPNL